MASRSFFLSYKHVNIAHVKTHTDTHTLSQPTPPPSPLVLIIPLQIRRSISSRIIVSPLLTPPPQLLYIQSRERSCPLSPCQPRWPGSSGSHNPSRPIRTPCRCKAQLDDSIPQEERRWIKKRERERESQSLWLIYSESLWGPTLLERTPILCTLIPNTRSPTNPPLPNSSSFFYCICEEW